MFFHPLALLGIYNTTVTAQITTTCDEELFTFHPRFSECDGPYIQFEITGDLSPIVSVEWRFGQLEYFGAGGIQWYPGTYTDLNVDYLYPILDPALYDYIADLTITLNDGSTCYYFFEILPSTSNRTLIGAPDATTYLSSLPTMDFIGGNFLFLGEVVLDAPDANAAPNANTLEWVNTDVLMGAGASMVVSSGYELTFRNSIVQGCDQMWDQIYIETGAVVESNWLNVFKDARILFNMENKSTLQLENDELVNNETAIRANLGDNQSASINLDRCLVEFIEYKARYAGQPSPVNGSPRGIFTRKLPYLTVGTQVPGTITNPNLLEYNLFKGLNYGIQSSGSSMLVERSRFENVFSGFLSEGPGRLELYGLGTDVNDPATFDGVARFCVDSKQKIGTLIRNVKTTNTNGAIRMTYNVGVPIVIENNLFEVSSIGINSIDNLPIYQEIEEAFQIRNNTIVLDGPSFSQGTAISLDEPVGDSDASPDGLKPLIQNNTIDLVKGAGGILANGPLDFVADNNVINLTDSRNRFGISTNGTQYSVIQDNTITGVSTTGEYNEAIIIGTSPYTAITCNNLDNTETGIRFSGASTNTNVVGNGFDRHNIGLYYRQSAVVNSNDDISQTGDQYGAGNEWYADNYGDAAARHDGENGMVELSRYFVHVLSTSGSPFYPPSISKPNATEEWFVFDPQAEPTDCEEILDLPENTYFVSGESEQIAQGQISAGYYTDPVRYQAQMQLYESLTMDTTLAWQNNPVLDSFYQAVTTSSIGDYYFMEQQITNWLEPGGQIVNDIAYYDELIYDHLDNLRDLQQQVNTANTPADSAAFKSTMDAVALQLDTAYHNRIYLEDIYDSVRIANAQQIRTLNNGLSATEVFEVNTRTVNDIYLSSIINGGITSSEKSTLQSIAGECPLLGGPAVYKSRAILADTTVYDDSDLCLQQGLQFREALVEEIMYTDIELSPNPASDAVNVLHSEDAIPTEVQVFDLQGRRVLSASLSQSMVLSVAELPSGMYVCRVMMDDEVLTVQKLVVND